MKLTIKEKKENKLHGRTEISFEIEESKQTPSRKECREKIAATINGNADLIVIDNLTKKFGSSSIKGNARQYKDAKLLKNEPVFMLKRNGLFEEKKAEAKKEEVA